MKNSKPFFSFGMMALLMVGGFASQPIGVVAQDAPPPPPPPPPPPDDGDGDFVPPPPPTDFEDSSSAQPPGDTGGSGGSSGGSTVKPPTSKPNNTIPAKKVPPGQELVSIDFPEPTPIKDIIKTVGLWTGKNFILPPNVNAKVQIISPQQMTKEEAYQAFLSALNVAGFTTVDTGKIVKIVNKQQASGSNIKTYYSAYWAPMTDEVITQIIPLSYIDAQTVQSQLSRILRESNVVPFATTNSLIVSDTGHKIRRLLEIIRLLDIKGNQPQVAIFNLRNTDAQETSKKVQEVFGGKSGGGSLYLQKVIVDDRTNSLILIGPPRGLTDVIRLIRRLDRPLEDQSSQAGIHVRPLDFADAEKLGATLQSLAQGGGLRNNRARPGGAPAGQPAAADLGGVKITADKTTNSLIIQGSKAAFKEIDTIIRQLDKKRDQVYVECDIIDVNLGDDLTLNMSVLAGASAANGKFNVPLAFQPGTAAAFGIENKSATASSDFAKAIPNGAILGVMGAQKIDIGNGIKLSPGAFMQALKEDRSTNVLQTPSLLVSDNEEAVFDATERENLVIPNVDPATKIVMQKLESFDASLSLTIKPQVSQADFVSMMLKVKAESFGTRRAEGPPNINKRSSNSQVVVQNQQTIVLSGLNRDIDSQSKSKVPILGDIPILGWFFRNTSSSKMKTNLTVFITPYIVRGSEDLTRIYEKKVRERDEFLRAFYGDGYKKQDSFKRMPGMDRAVVPTPRPVPTVIDLEPQRPANGNGQENDVVFPTDEPIVAPPGTGGGSGGSSVPPPPPTVDFGSDAPPPPPPADVPPPP